MGPTVKVREKFQVTIPEHVREEVPLKVGEKVEVVARGNEIVIRPVMEVHRSQAWFWRADWQEQISKAMNDLQKGRIRVFKSAKEARKKLGD